MQKKLQILIAANDNESFPENIYRELESKIDLILNKLFSLNLFHVDLNAEFSLINYPDKPAMSSKISNADKNEVIICPAIKKYPKIFELIAEGLNSKEIGNQLKLSSRTVEAQLKKAGDFYNCKKTINLIYYLTKNKILN